MFFKISVFLCFVACVLGLDRGDMEKYGIFRNILNSNIFKCDLNRNLNLDVSDTKVHFFDFANNIHKTFLISDAASGILSLNNLNKNKKFIMFVGGFTSHINHTIEVQIREAYKTYPDSYLIIPDHSRYTNDTSEGEMKSYDRSVTFVHYIGKALGKMWSRIHEGGVSAKNIHCVGHSLGGQILGHLGESFLNETGKKIVRISALDPAGPCFTKSHIRNQVRSGLAEHVEVYHCNSGALGSSSILADVDYIVNKNGENQATCWMPYIPGLIYSTKAATCSHRSCIDIWTATVRNQDLFPAYSCNSYESFKNNQCAGETTIAGAHGPATAKGVYYFSTADYDLDKMK